MTARAGDESGSGGSVAAEARANGKEAGALAAWLRAAADESLPLPALGPQPDTTPLERARSDRDETSDIVLVCDHASNARPTRLGDLGLSEADLSRHIAYDVGARGLVLALSAALNAPAILSTFSRLVIDPNRGEDDPTLLMRLYDRSVIPGNARIDAAERNHRLDTLHRPYHAAVEALASQACAAGRRPVFVSVHSFTPQLRGKPPRPWHVGVLWRDDPATAARLLDLLRVRTDLIVGDNQPYPGALDGDTMTRHAAARGARHVVVEVRNDLIRTAAGQVFGAQVLAPVLRETAAAG